MMISNHLTSDEWVACYVLYLIHSVEFPEEFPLEVSLGHVLTAGVWLLNLAGYRAWKGIKVKGRNYEPLEPIEEGLSGAIQIREFLAAGIDLKNYWRRAIGWLEAQDLQVEPKIRSSLLGMLRTRLELIVPGAKVGWVGAVPECNESQN